MSHFYADIQGNKGTATRCGTKNSGIDGHIRGWNIGARVFCYVNDQGEDECKVVLTPGSGHGGKSKTLGTFTENDL